MGFTSCLISSAAEVGGGRAWAREIAGEDRRDEGVEDDTSTVGLRKCKPHHEDELECVVEGEPVDSTDSAFKNSQESVNDPVGQPLSIISFSSAKKRIQRVITRENEPSGVHEKLTGDVEEDKEKVDTSQSKEEVNLRYRGLLLDVVENRVF